MSVYTWLRDTSPWPIATAWAAPRGDADPLTPDGYRLWARCPYGMRFDRWVTPADAEADLLRSALLAFEN